MYLYEINGSRGSLCPPALNLRADFDIATLNADFGGKGLTKSSEDNLLSITGQKLKTTTYCS